jgi:hypothetical protein
MSEIVTSEELDNDNLYWLISTPLSGFNEQLGAFYSLIDPRGQLQVYVKFSGTAAPPKEFGYSHLGIYSRQVTVNPVLIMKPYTANECTAKSLSMN